MRSDILHAALIALLVGGCAVSGNSVGDAAAGSGGGGGGQGAGTGGSAGAGAGTGGRAAGTGGTGSGTGGTGVGTGGSSVGTGGSGGSTVDGGVRDSGPITGTGGSAGTGTCCPDGNCLCHGPNPTALTSANGPFRTATFTISTGTVHYPTDAQPPFAGVAICGGFTNTGPEMAPWGTFYASHGIVTVVTTTLGLDVPDIRATKLLAAVEQLKGENTKSGSPLMGKLADRYGTSGYSMGGGGTTIASSMAATLKTSVGLAPWGATGAGVQVPTLLLCGSSDGTAPCSMAEGAYTGIAGATPKMMVSITGVSHLQWFGPTNAGGGTSGEYALAFQKVYLAGDQRWKPLLLQKPSNGTQTTNIQ